MKKKFLVALPLALVLAFGVTACGETTENPTETLYNVTVVDGTIKGTNGWNHQSYAEGTSVTVQALAASTERGAFKNWEVAGESVETATEYTFTVGTADITVTAKYEAAPAAAQYVSVTVVGGTITGTDYNHDKVEKGSKVSVSPAADKFVEWQVNGTAVSTNSTYELTVNEDTVIAAIYEGASVWDGEYPASAPVGFLEDDESHSWHITSAAALAYWGRLVTCNNDGTDKNLHKYSTLDQSSYANSPTDPVWKYYNANNAWTLYLDVDVDLAGYKWDPINTLQWSLNGLTFNGNGHTISNLYAECQATIPGTDSTSAGFFGYILKDDVTILNVTFDGARITSTSASKQNMAVVIGYANPSQHWDYFKGPQNIIMSNVHIKNSIVGSQTSYKIGLFVGRSGSYAVGETDATNYVFTNCTASDSKVIGTRILGGFVGYAAHSADGNIAPGGALSVIASECYLKNVDFITMQGNNTPGLAIPGTLVCGDYGWILDMVNHTVYQYTNDLAEQFVENVNVFDMHVATVATNGEELLALLQDDEGNAKLGDIFIACDIDMTDFVNEYFTWEPTEGQNIYLLNGATVTGLDLGNAVRLMSGARNSSGSLIVTNLAGTEIGAWVVSADGKTASYQAK